MSLRVLAGSLALSLACASNAMPSELVIDARPLYVVSDLHLGMGRTSDGEWHPMEDFRWPNALRGFLRRVHADNPKGAVLVIAGDFLELWQHPDVACAASADVECGCSLAQMGQVVATVLKAHDDVFQALGEFLHDPANSVIVIPGNHDAALTNDDMWQMVKAALPEGRDRFTRVEDGLLVTRDGRVAIEHGHQQKFEVNSFPDWPRGVVKQCADGPRFFRPWGENFVQSLYNDVEMKLPLIDNLVPDSAGKALYQQYSTNAGTKWADVARFIEFNLLETSYYQKAEVLDLRKRSGRLTADEIAQCKTCLGADLLVIGNPPAEAALKQSGDDPALRRALQDRVAHLDPDELQYACERAVMVSGGRLPLSAASNSDPQCAGTLKTGLDSILDPDGAKAIRARVADIYGASKGRLALYVFGHTHQARLGVPVEMPDGLTVDAINTGAFQRLMNLRFLQGRMKAGETSELAALERTTFADVAACYSVVKVAYTGRRPNAQLVQWFMREEDEDGDFIGACDTRCSAPPANCGKAR